MTNSIKTNAYSQHSLKYNNVKPAQTDSFRKTNGFNVLDHISGTKDTVELSQDAKDVLNNAPIESDNEKVSKAKDKTAEWKEKLEQMRNDMNWLMDEIRRAGEVSEGMAEAMKEMIKCMQIAMRIMSGHNVPESDHRYLMDKDSALYSKAIMMRMERIDPDELERLSEDEEENSEESSEIDTGSISSTDTSAEES